MRTLCVSLVLVLAISASASSGAGDAWNQIAASRHFDQYPVAPGDSFAQHYHGSNLTGDFASMVAYVNQLMNSSIDPNYDDLMDVRLDTWGGIYSR